MTIELANNVNTDQKHVPVRDDYLSSEIYLVLHTKIAQSLFQGSWRYKQMGLLQFAKIMQVLWQAAKQDDPYAEWYLMKTYEQIKMLQEEIKHVEAYCRSRLDELRGLEIQLFRHANPTKLPLRFSMPFSYMASYLLADLDYVLRQAYTLKRLGIYLDANYGASIFVRKLRDVFIQPRKWRHTGVTRQAIMENNQVAQQAREVMGEVPA